MKKAQLVGAIFVVAVLLIILGRCNGCGFSSQSGSRAKPDSNQRVLGDTTLQLVSDTGPLPDEIPSIPSPREIRKIYYYLENSESMFGYVEGTADFEHVLMRLINEREQDIQDKFYFVNDSVTDRGNSRINFLNNLNINTLRCGGYSNSNLTRLIKMALDSASRDQVSILITDGIYSVSSASDPDDLLFQLQLFQGEIQNVVRERIQSENLATLLVKFQSQFRGKYFPAAGGSIDLNQMRPYYIMIFGDAGLINSTYPDEYLRGLNGFNFSARFFKMEDEPIPFEFCSYNNRGRYKPDHRDKTGSTIQRIQRDREGVFHISVAVDFNHIPFDDRYFQNKNNYTCTNTYDIIEVNSRNTFTLEDRERHLDRYSASHIITIGTTGAPWGQVEIRLTKQNPAWIEHTHIDDDRFPAGNTEQTFGFRYLVQGIVEGYERVSTSDYIGIIKMTLNR